MNPINQHRQLNRALRHAFRDWKPRILGKEQTDLFNRLQENTLWLKAYALLFALHVLISAKVLSTHSPQWLNDLPLNPPLPYPFAMWAYLWVLLMAVAPVFMLPFAQFVMAQSLGRKRLMAVLMLIFPLPVLLVFAKSQLMDFYCWARPQQIMDYQANYAVFQHVLSRYSSLQSLGNQTIKSSNINKTPDVKSYFLDIKDNGLTLEQKRWLLWFIKEVNKLYALNLSDYEIKKCMDKESQLMTQAPPALHIYRKGEHCATAL